MKVCSRTFLGAVLLVLLAGLGTARAQSQYFAPVVYGSSTVDGYANRISALEAELASLRTNISQGDGYVGGTDVGCDGGCGAACPCCDDCWLGNRGSGCGGWVAQVDLLILQYHRTGGMRVGLDPGDRVVPDYEFAPRITLGWAGPEGTGFRIRWFDFNDASAAQDVDDRLFVDTFTFDAEIFDTITLNRNWSLEVSGGIRFVNFNEVMLDGTDVRHNWFHGHGLVFGLELRREFCNGTLYGGLRGAVMLGDRYAINEESGFQPFEDAVTGMWEIGVGYERDWCLADGSLAYLRIGLETHNWYNFSGHFDPSSEDDFEGDADVGFGIGMIGFGIVR